MPALNTNGGALGRLRPPIVLAYHGLGSLPRSLDPHNLLLSPSRFRRQVRSLRRRGYHFLPLSAVAAEIDSGPPPAGACVLTFDDGTLDNLHTLAPILSELDVPATVFVCPGLLGSPHFAMPAEAGVRLMDAEELRQLAALRQIEIGSHTNMHTDLSRASPSQAREEMVGSRRALEDLLQRPVQAFAYPKCDYSPICPEAARQAGYEVAVTCGGRGGWRRFELGRESITSLDGTLTFALKSRRLFLPLLASPPGRLAAWGARPLRHGSS